MLCAYGLPLLRRECLGKRSAVALLRRHPARQGHPEFYTLYGTSTQPETIMTLSMYQASVPRFINALNNLSAILDKAQAHVDAKKLDEATLTSFRLFPDMLPMARQILIATDTAKGLAARLAGVDIPVYEDTEKTLGELKARIAKTVAYLQTFRPEQIDGTENKEIIIKRGDKETRYNGMQFLLGHAVPNVYFHITTAYNILRHNGVEIGKRDYLGNP
jgi:hypothetical protein